MLYILYCTDSMRETIRLVAQDIVLIGGALCILIVLLLLIIRLRISYTWLQAGKAIQSAVRTIIQTVLNPIVAITAAKQLRDVRKSEKNTKPQTKKTPQKKTRKK